MPQILMLNHASKVNWDRMESRRKAKSEAEKKKKEQEDQDPIVMNGKRLSELSSEESAAYYASGFTF